MQTEIKVKNLTSSCVFCYHQPLLPQNKIKWIKIHQLQPTDVNPLRKPMFPEKSVRAIYRSEKHTHQLHFLLKSLHDTKKWSNIPYKLVDQSTVVEDMNSPSWHSYDYILSFCILKNKQIKVKWKSEFLPCYRNMWKTHRVLWSVLCTSNQKINTINWLHGLYIQSFKTEPPCLSKCINNIHDCIKEVLKRKKRLRILFTLSQKKGRTFIYT